MLNPEQASLDQRWNEFQQLNHLKDHWYWRPGWRQGRSFYTWHLTFEDASQVRELAATVQATLEPGWVDAVAADGLHLTMQGLGFTDEVGDEDVAAIVHAVTNRCRQIEPFDLTLGPVDPDAEGVGLLVRPWEPVIRTRQAVRDGIRDVWAEVPEPADGFRPHVTAAYSNSAAPAGPVVDRLAELRSLPPASARIGAAQLIRLNRDAKEYRWTVVATAPLSG